MCTVFEGQAGRHLGAGGSRESTFELTGLAPNEIRALSIFQKSGKIGKVLTVHYDEKGPRASR